MSSRVGESASDVDDSSTPTSPSLTNGTPQNASGSKRKRNEETNGESSHSRRRTIDPEASGDSSDGESEDSGDSCENNDDELYDPDQPLEERRRVQRGFRELLQNLTENSEEYLQSGSTGLSETIQKADAFLKKVRRPGEAASDSRLLVSTTDLSYRKTLRLTQGSLSQGVDVDEFVSKCITYMRRGGGIEDDNAPELSSTQRQRRLPRARGDPDEDEVGDEGDMMNWTHLGRFAALPSIRRPPLPGFLLGPLSVEKKSRKVTKRSAPFRPNNLTETRPEVLDVTDFAKTENDLTAICSKILLQLRTVQEEVQEAVAELIEDDMDDQTKSDIMHKHGLRSTGGIDVMRFVVNPRSFGQTVENMFYVSFLIRDGRVEIDYDEHDLPALAPVERDEDEDDRVRQGASKHQAVMSMDMATWQDIIETLDLREPMIEHRKEATAGGPGARGWYS